MITRGYFFILAVAFLFPGCSIDSLSQEGSVPPDHSSWTELLQKYVDEDGLVAYDGFLADSLLLDSYLDLLTESPPDEEAWTKKQQIAYWINAYNAFTIRLVLDHYPIESIKDIGSTIQIPFVNSPWDIKIIKINERKLDLNNIEHSILRKKFDEPRIHFAINCASYSCPKLRREAYIATRLDEQLDEQAVEFVNDRTKNMIRKDRAEISKIFNWFKGDFTRNRMLYEYLNLYSEIKLYKSTRITHLKYDWSLNGKKNISEND